MEAPTFTPTEEEFRDPMEYIKSIYDKASKYGICKVIPPRDWDPDFAIDLSVCVAVSRWSCQVTEIVLQWSSIKPSYRTDSLSRDSISGPDAKNSTLSKEVSLLSC